jgi:hypothetical protein
VKIGTLCRNAELEIPTQEIGTNLAREPPLAPPKSLKRFFATDCDKASPNAFVALHSCARYVSKAAI